MILIAGLIAVVVSVVVFGGDLARLAELRLRSPQIIIVALMVQIAVINILPAALPTPVDEAVHLATYAAAAIFVVLNRRVAGLAVVALGGGANLAAISANGGRMPASPTALRIAGIQAKTHFTNSGLVPHARLAVLGDIFAVPRSWPLPNVFSIGDIFLLAGAFILLHQACQSRLAKGVTPAAVSG